LSDTVIIGANEVKGTVAVHVTWDAEDEESAYPYEVVLFLTQDNSGNWLIQEVAEL
jgi:hypothetical protein